MIEIMKIYIGYRLNAGQSNELTSFFVRILAQDQQIVDEYPLRHIPWHSPTGMEWGYSGSGPSDLALAILNDYFADQGEKELYKADISNGSAASALLLHQSFKVAFVSKWPRKMAWAITTEEIESWVKFYRKRSKAKLN